MCSDKTAFFRFVSVDCPNLVLFTDRYVTVDAEDSIRPNFCPREVLLWKSVSDNEKGVILREPPKCVSSGINLTQTSAHLTPLGGLPTNLSRHHNWAVCLYVKGVLRAIYHLLVCAVNIALFRPHTP